MLTRADAMNEAAMIFTLEVDALVTDESEIEILDILRQRLHLSTDYGGYNPTRQADERHVAHYVSLAAIMHPLYELMLKHAPNRFADDIRLLIAQPNPTQQWAAAAYTAYHAAVQTTEYVPQDIIERAHRVTPHPRPAVKAGRQHTRVDNNNGYRKPRIP